ncbi:hypothetical protein GOQ27_15330 [Clostridium sp. D2Q-11]|uniref:MgtE intracellular N domain protein n=1 Tax=Anaeromonas frigoriresistens TaxID=2683708 RepID=A0A942UZG2_9FIRM|nr:hypothetical protein [Anaeromonas frigoriresistens]MBS4539846.1 hypothetical protein [Anaeromonas frigoriresistens]
MGDEMKNEKISGIIKIILVIIIVFILIPIVTLTIFYKTNSEFKVEANKFLRNMPGSIGDYFNQYPTTAETKDKVLYISEHFSTIDPDSAADKLYIIKKDNSDLYFNIIQQMNKLSPDKTEIIIKKVRDIELRKDLLISVYDEITSTKENELQEDVKKIEGMDLLVAKNIILEYYNNENFKRINEIFDSISIDRAVDLLYYFDEDVYDYILNNIDNNKRIEISIKLTEKNLEMEKLIRQSEIYQVNNSTDSLKEIGNEDTYNFNQLSIVYLNLTTTKAAEILSQIEDKEFIESLFTEMRNIELLKDILDSRTVKIASEIEQIKEYNNKLQELVKIYQKMDSSVVASIIEKMFKEDAKLAVDLIGRMPKTKVAEIMNYVEADISNELSKKLTLE